MSKFSLVTKIIWVVALSLVTCILLTVGIITYFSFDLPKIKNIADYTPPIPSKILASDGTVLAEIGKEKREIIKVQEVPKHIIDSFLAAEDDKFYEHKGVDYIGVLRAMLANLKAGKVVQGGSTITQQLAKSLLLSRERSFSRKAKDFLLAQKIEEQFSKEEILFLYLNQIYLGGGYYGVKEAFKGYFGKELAETTFAEAALIAGLLVAPTKYSPYVNPIFAKRRQHYVLRRLFETEKINKKEYEDAIAEKVKFRVKLYSEFKAGHFTDWIRQRVIELVGEEAFLNGGYTIQTTLNYPLQEVAEKSVLKGVIDIDKRQGYKGPIGFLASDALEAWERKTRKETLEGMSNYFIIDANGEKEFENKHDPIETDSIIENRKSSLDTAFRIPFKGNRLIDKIPEILSQNQVYQAVVLSTNDDARLVTVTIGGTIGVISTEGFSWAHKREISEDPIYFQEITKPSTILKAGDLIEVKILKKEINVSEVIHESLRKTLSKSNVTDLSKEKVMHLSLFQTPDVQGALIALDPQTGYIISFVGGNDFSKSQFNRVIQSQRQPGSSFKPFIYSLALENGYNPSSVIMDSPESLTGAEDGPNWKPKNYDGKYLGPITFRTSLEKSRNVPTIKLANEMGLNEMIKFTRRIGMLANIGENLSFALGSFGISLFELAKLYAIFPNSGKKIAPISIVSIKDRNGVDLLFNENPPSEAPVEKNDNANTPSQPKEDAKTAKEIFTQGLSGDQVIDKRIAFIVSSILKGVIRSGTATAARVVGNNIAGKTGTTSNYVDAWFLGYSHNVVVGTWTGFDENQTLGFGETGTRSALPIWIDYMTHAISKFGDFDFKSPPGLINLYINKESGDQVNPSNPNAFLETFIEGFEPGQNKSSAINSEKDSTQGKGSIIFEEDDYLNQE